MVWDRGPSREETLRRTATDVVRQVLFDCRNRPAHELHAALSKAYPWPWKTGLHWKVWREVVLEMVKQ